MPRRVRSTVLLPPVVLVTLLGLTVTVQGADYESAGWARFSATSPDEANAPPVAEPLPVPTSDVLADSPRLFRAGPSPQYFAGQHEPPPNYNLRDPNYYPDAGLGFPILSAHGTWIGDRHGVRAWKHRGYHEKYHQTTIQWRW